jgi:hypothetical protein
VAGLISVILAVGHETIGLAAVLPNINEDRLPGTRFGPPSLTVAMLRVTWHLVTVFVLAVGGLLMTLAFVEEADPTTLMFRWFSAMWLGATAVAFWVVRRRPRDVLRLPVPFVWPVIALLCWKASG